MSFISRIPVFILPLFAVACFEADQRVDPYPGDVVLIDHNIIDYFSYFDFETGRTIRVHPTDAWQLAFESESGGWHILVNSGDGWFIRNSQESQWENINGPADNTEWEYDRQYDFPDSTAVGTWVDPAHTSNYSREVYYLGKDTGGEFGQQKKVQFIHVDSSAYVFRYFDFDSGFTDTITIRKLDSVNFVFYDFHSKQQVNLEPASDTYDIIFCPYYDLATRFGITIPYLVRGVLLNTKNTQAIMDSLSTYEQIDYESLELYALTSQRDVIGYRWKEADVNTTGGTAEYRVFHNYIYIVHTAEGRYYKMRFLSFTYNGSSGYPQFEYRELLPTL
jgi:hypothetical protein